MKMKEGWREIEVGEELIIGDEYTVDVNQNYWIPTMYVGSKITQEDLSQRTYRRKIEPSMKNMIITTNIVDLIEAAHGATAKRGIVCPFCGESDFDKEGLKSHLMHGDCEQFNECENLARIGW